MQEQNETTTSPPLPKEFCSIRIVFPVTSDEQAIEYKKQVSSVLGDVKDLHIEFSIRTIPSQRPTSM